MELISLQTLGDILKEMQAVEAAKVKPNEHVEYLKCFGFHTNEPTTRDTDDETAKVEIPSTYDTYRDLLNGDIDQVTKIFVGILCKHLSKMGLAFGCPRFYMIYESEQEHKLGTEYKQDHIPTILDKDYCIYLKRYKPTGRLYCVIYKNPTERIFQKRIESSVQILSQDSNSPDLDKLKKTDPSTVFPLRSLNPAITWNVSKQTLHPTSDFDKNWKKILAYLSVFVSCSWNPKFNAEKYMETIEQHLDTYLSTILYTKRIPAVAPLIFNPTVDNYFLDVQYKYGPVSPIPNISVVEKLMATTPTTIGVSSQIEKERSGDSDIELIELSDEEYSSSMSSLSEDLEMEIEN